MELINVFKLYPYWSIWLWIFILLLATLVEILGLSRFHGAIPLTWLIRDSIPQWLRWMLLGWLIYHFGILTNTGQPSE